MTNVIWKFLLTDDAIELMMPEGAKILDAQDQAGTWCLWAIVSPEKPRQKRKFRVFGTGHELPEGHFGYIGTIQQEPFVWHVFEELQA